MVFILLMILFIWFSLLLPGVKIGKFILCGSSVKEREKPELVMWLVFLILLPTYIFFPLAGNILILIFLLLWFIAQWFFTLRYIFFPNERKIEGYNNYFASSHYIIKPSKKRLVPDTYHIVLFSLIIVCLFATTINLICLYIV